jgi:pyruvate-ferredoxin/flavodoxin oxidoreductase
VNTPNFVACHVPAYLHLYDVTKGLKKNGTFLLNSVWPKEEVVQPPARQGEALSGGK